MADLVSLLGTIGTWVAVILAITTLIGVVGPLLAFRAAMTQRNRALNSVKDQNGDYISKGIGYGRKIRLFRSPRVPALAPSDSSGLFVIPDTNMVWTFNKIKGTTCRASWAKVCRLIECYTVNKQGHTVRVLDKSGKGDLDIRQGRPRLPLSRYWVLVIGLLGRYSDHPKEATGERPIFLRHLDEEQIGFSESDAGSEISGSEETEAHEASLQTTIRGFTGSFRIIKTATFSEGEFGFERTLLYERISQSEIGTSPDGESLPLSNHFWLAMGLLPLPKRGQSRLAVASLEDPFLISDDGLQYSHDGIPKNSSDTDSDASSSNEDQINANEGPVEQVSEEQESDNPSQRSYDDVSGDNLDQSGSNHNDLPELKLFPVRNGPTTLRLAMEALQLSDVEILSFQPSTLQNHELLPENLPVCQSQGVYTRFRTFLARQRDIQRIVCAFLELPWHQRGYLIMDENTLWWRELLTDTTNLLPAMYQAIGREGSNVNHQDVAAKLQHLDISRWKGRKTFHHKQTKALYEASITVKEAIEQPMPVIMAVAVLIVTDKAFQEHVTSLVGKDGPTYGRTTKLRISLQDGHALLTKANSEVPFEFSADMLPGGTREHDEAEVKPLDVTLIALWVALHCKLWLTSPKSTPLINFFLNLKEVVHVR